jgi:hypothetical protein
MKRMVCAFVFLAAAMMVLAPPIFAQNYIGGMGAQPEVQDPDQPRNENGNDPSNKQEASPDDPSDNADAADQNDADQDTSDSAQMNSGDPGSNQESTQGSSE